MRHGWSLSVAVIAACGRLNFTPDLDNPDNDGGIEGSLDADADAGAVPLGPFGPPIRIMDINSTSEDYGPSISSDGNELFFASNRGTSFDLHVANRVSIDTFTPAAVITSLRTSAAEFDAEISASGLELYFISSAQPAGLRRSTRTTTADPWDAPTVITLGAGTEGPSLGVGDLRMLIEKNGAIEEWMRPSTASTQWQVVRTHTSLGSLLWPALSEDGLEMFATRKPGDELVHVTRATLDDPFGAPQRYLFGSSIDDASIYDPELSRDGRTLYLSISTGGDPDLYVTTR